MLMGLECNRVANGDFRLKRGGFHQIPSFICKNLVISILEWYNYIDYEIK